MTFIIGVAGALTVLTLLGVGFFMGWQQAGRKAPPAPKAPTEAERHRLREEQEAFHLLQNYTVERAYGGKEA